MKWLGKDIRDTHSEFRNHVSIGRIKHFLSADVGVAYAHNADNSVAMQATGIIIPAGSIITNVAAYVKRVSNLSTHLVNLHIADTNARAADLDVTGDISPVEILGAGVANTDSTDSASAEDIDLRSDVGEVWICRDTVRVGAGNHYLYVCNAGTGNGTANPDDATKPVLSVIVEYYGGPKPIAI